MTIILNTPTGNAWRPHNPERHFLIDGEPVLLSPLEARLFAVLLHHTPKSTPSHILARAVWAPPRKMPVDPTKAISTLIMLLRIKLPPGCIKSHGWGMGYYYVGPTPNPFPNPTYDPVTNNLKRLDPSPNQTYEGAPSKRYQLHKKHLHDRAKNWAQPIPRKTS